ncbi:hypothetical protein QE152_g14177 [Popillia japonica]|uniref:Uncharacterized protein n=1 Tax=Popillia japonica TaxID=7064 RepID=A0AAW1LBL4_POPJA
MLVESPGRFPVVQLAQGFLESSFNYPGANGSGINAYIVRKHSFTPGVAAMSLAYMEKSRGDRAAPWGTLAVVGLCEELSLSTLIRNVRWQMNDHISRRRPREMPALRNGNKPLISHSDLLKIIVQP